MDVSRQPAFDVHTGRSRGLVYVADSMRAALRDAATGAGLDGGVGRRGMGVAPGGGRTVYLGTRRGDF